MILDNTEEFDQREMVKGMLSKGDKRVLDLGGAMNHWARPHVTTCLDIQPSKEFPHFVGDINDPDGWEELLGYVEDEGKYDFCVCTHVLEDLRNPTYVLKQLPKVADAGFIAMPSRHWELALVECGQPDEMHEWGVSGNWKGFFHHRWIFRVINGTLWLFPKLNFLEYLEGLDWAKGMAAFHEMSFFWKFNIPFKIINDDFMGPTGPHICRHYRDLLSD